MSQARESFGFHKDKICKRGEPIDLTHETALETLY